LTLRTEGKIDHKQLKALISGIATFVTRVKIVRPVKKISIFICSSQTKKRLASLQTFGFIGGGERI
jgi:hypothetical protein